MTKLVVWKEKGKVSSDRKPLILEDVESFWKKVFAKRKGVVSTFVSGDGKTGGGRGGILVRIVLCGAPA